MYLYVKSENYHFDGFISGVIVDEENNRVALYEKEGESEPDDVDLNSIKWEELKTFNLKGKEVTVSAIGGFYKSFIYLNKCELDA